MGDRTRQNHSAADSLITSAESGAAAAKTGRAAFHEQALVGEELADLRARTFNHMTHDSLARRRTARSAVSPDNRRAVKDPQRTPYDVTGSGLSERPRPRRRRARLADRPPIPGPRASSARATITVDERDPSATAAPGAGRTGTTRAADERKHLSNRPRDGEVAMNRWRPAVATADPAAESRVAAPHPADRAYRELASSQRRADALDVARASDRGDEGGRGQGSRAGRRGSNTGAQKGRAVWLNQPDRRYMSYFQGIYRKLQPLWHFPRRLALLLEQGDVLVQFTLRADGTVRRVRVRKSSGFPQFDRNVVNAINQAAPFSPIPAGLGRPLEIVAPFEFVNPMVR